MGWADWALLGFTAQLEIAQGGTSSNRPCTAVEQWSGVDTSTTTSTTTPTSTSTTTTTSTTTITSTRCCSSV